MPETRCGATQKVTVGKHDIYVTVNFYDDLAPGEVFIKVAKEGSFVRGMFDVLAKQMSLLLQSGWTLPEVSSKIKDITFDGSDLFLAICDAAENICKEFQEKMK